MISGGHPCLCVPVPREPEPVEDVVTLARYPFLPQASPWIAALAGEHRITLDELLEGSFMEPARARARIRLIETVEAEEGVSLSGGDLHSENGRLIEAFSFYYARLVVCATRDERLVARWALAEAQRAERLLRNDERALPVVARTYMSDIRSREHRGPSGRGERGTALPHLEWTIGMADFIEVCPKITGDRWRLANTELSEGSIRLHSEAQYSSSAKVARLLRERIKAGIEADALEKVAEVNDELASRLALPIGIVRNLMEARVQQSIALAGVDEEDWPPCMRRIVADLANGVNVNHFGRVFLASMGIDHGIASDHHGGLLPWRSRFQRSHHHLPGRPRLRTGLHASRVCEVEGQPQLPCPARRRPLVRPRMVDASAEVRALKAALEAAHGRGGRSCGAA